MKLLILDYFRRWWWVFAIIAVAQMVIGFIFAWGPDIPVIVPPFAVYFGAFLLSFELQRGYPGAVSTLPLSVKQIARAWWLATVVLPAIVITVMGFFAAGLSFFLWHGPGTFNLIPIIIICVFNALWLGAMFCLLTGLPVANTGTWQSRVGNGIFGAIWGACLGGGFFMFQHLTLARLAIVSATCLVLSIIGWFRAENLVIKRAAFRLTPQTAVPRSAARPQYRITRGLSGITLLLVSSVTHALSFCLAIFAVLGLMAALENFQHPNVQFAKQFVLFFSSGFPSWLFIMILLFPLLMQLRQLRTLPLSTISLATLLILIPMLAIFLMGGATAGVVFLVNGAGREPQLLSYFLTLAAGTTFCIPLAVWFGSGRMSTYLMIFAITFIPGLIQQFFSIDFEITYSALIFSVSLIFAWVTTTLALTRSSNAYRRWTNSFGNGWNWGR